MPFIISGPGNPLPTVVTYPQILAGAPVTQRGNYISLAPGETWPFPATGGGFGFWVEGGPYCVLQWLDPITGIWRGLNSQRRGPMFVGADGFSWRMANLTACPVAAVVTNGGSGWTQATTTITSSAGGSLWQPVIGGSVSITVIAAGAGYSIPPVLLIDPPPQPGVQASAVATIASGTISGITNVNMGAGYTVAPTVQVVPVSTDPNYIGGSITAARAGAAIIAANQGRLIAALCTNPGTAQTGAVAPTLTVAGGAGVTATASALMMFTALGVTVTGVGTGQSATNEVTSVGGQPTFTPAFTAPGNPELELTNYIPRKASMIFAVATTITTISAIYDHGLFVGATPLALLTSQVTATGPTIAFTIGGITDSFFLQPT